MPSEDPAIESLVVGPGPQDQTVRAAEGEILSVPAGWELLLPGDATLTRRVKALGPTWTVQEKRGRRNFSRGVWAPAEQIARVRNELKIERSSESYAKRRQTQAKRRERDQAAYEQDFRKAVYQFLDFADCHHDLAEKLAGAVTTHAVPIGSGTVARTKRIPLERRAESAVIAWLRHQTTEYDSMRIARVKGKRREVRRALAERSRKLLADYREGKTIAADECVLRQALTRVESSP